MSNPSAPVPQITLRLPLSLRAQLEQRAAAERMGLSLYVRRLLWDHVEPRPPAPAAPVPLATQEDAA